MLNNQTPKVTVLMPVYNGEKYLREAIDSILDQTFTNFEFIIIDDGSLDNSVEIIKSYQDPRIRLIKNEHNQGLVYSLNLGLSLAQGKYVARMDCDDISLPERLQKQIEFLDKNAEIAVVGTWVKIFNEKKGNQTTWQCPIDSLSIKWNLLFHNPIPHSSVMFRKDIILSNHGYSQEMLDVEDYDLWRRLASKVLLANLPSVLLFYRQHDSNIGSINRKNQLKNAAKLSQIIIEDLLLEKIDYKSCYNLFFQDDQSYNNAESICLLTIKINNKFKQLNALNRAGIKYINYDTGSKIYQFISPYIREIKSWKFIILSLYLNPHLIFGFIKSF